MLELDFGTELKVENALSVQGIRRGSASLRHFHCLRMAAGALRPIYWPRSRKPREESAVRVEWVQLGHFRLIKPRRQGYSARFSAPAMAADVEATAIGRGALSMSLRT